MFRRFTIDIDSSSFELYLMREAGYLRPQATGASTLVYCRSLRNDQCYGPIFLR